MNATTAGKVLLVKRKVIGIILVRIKLNFIPLYNNSQGRYFLINRLYDIHFEVPSDSWNLSGSQRCDLCIIFCP